ncbi:MAG: D-2-hydroxyacid dehydrogenase family protein [Chloroflexi bacterium]|nr:D-2-hydroxyacid dehydrogenase family protein [Chloroflexota bacterium]
MQSTGSPRPRIVVINHSRGGFYDEFPYLLDGLRERTDLEVFGDDANTLDELAGRLAGAYGVIDIRARSEFGDQLFDRLPHLRVISIRGTTAPLVDEDAATERGILVTNTPYQSSNAVAEMSLALLLAANRRIPLVHNRIQAGKWQGQRGIELKGKTLGVIGLGQIGQIMCRLAAGIGMRVIAWSPTWNPARAAGCGAELVRDLDDLLRASDAISLHLRLSDSSRGTLGRRELSLLKNGAIVVNTARAGLYDEGALIDELKSGRLIAGLDVFSQEPVPEDFPLKGLDNVIMTPHSGANTQEVAEERGRTPAQNLEGALDGRPINVLNVDVLEHPFWGHLSAEAKKQAASVSFESASAHAGQNAP